MVLTVNAPVLAEDTFTDVGTEHWAYEFVEDMAARGLISGYGNGIFGVDDNVSRRDAFALFARMLGSASTANAIPLQRNAVPFLWCVSDAISMPHQYVYVQWY